MRIRLRQNSILPYRYSEEVSFNQSIIKLAKLILTPSRYFELQLKLCDDFKLPLFLHCRNAANDLYEILKQYSGLTGVVHSFDGTPEEAKQFIDSGFYIGLNGW